MCSGHPGSPLTCCRPSSRQGMLLPLPTRFSLCKSFAHEPSACQRQRRRRPRLNARQLAMLWSALPALAGALALAKPAGATCCSGGVAPYTVVLNWELNTTSNYMENPWGTHRQRASCRTERVLCKAACMVHPLVNIYSGTRCAALPSRRRLAEVAADLYAGWGRYTLRW
eukprot:scaffold1954_cov364-Prasinococcus_capsulatus_cf.AAC.20